MFRNNNTATVEPPVDLPAGFNDADSDMFVPEPLRALYPATTPKLKDVRERVDAIAHAQAVETVRARYENRDAPPSAQYANEIALESDSITEREFERLHALARHTIRLEAAHQQHQRQQAREANRTLVQAMHTCPICDEYDTVKNGYVDRRDLMGETNTNRRHHPIVSCWSCFNEAQHQLRQARARDIVDAGRTRTALITAHLGL